MVVVLVGCGTDVGGSSSPPTRVPGIAGLDGAAMLARLEDRGGYVCSGPEPAASSLQRWTCISEPSDPTVAPRVEVIIRGESLHAVDSLDVSVDLARVMASYGIAHMTLTYIVDATALPEDLRRAAREFLDTHGFEEGQADLPGLTMYLTGGNALRRLELVRNDFDETTVPFGK
jgi:hypothetical protein